MCEVGVYQYGVTNAEIDYNKVITLNAAVASFSVTFPPLTPIRRLVTNSNIENTSNSNEVLSNQVQSERGAEDNANTRSLQSETIDLLQLFSSKFSYLFRLVPEFVLSFSKDSVYLFHLAINVVVVVFIMLVFYVCKKLLKSEPKFESF